MSTENIMIIIIVVLIVLIVVYWLMNQRKSRVENFIITVNKCSDNNNDRAKCNDSRENSNGNKYCYYYSDLKKRECRTRN
jgi:uncharacterized protein YgiB involved in biofilm formation